MNNNRITPVPATQVEKIYHNETPNIPGGFKWNRNDEGKAVRIHFTCPCGCGSYIDLPVNADKQPFWNWDGNETEPTLTPSIWINKDRPHFNWHGYLTKGVFKPC